MSQPDELSQVKSLLLRQEMQRLDDLESEIQLLRKRLGDEQALQDSLTPVIANALARANHNDPAAITAVVAPVVVASLRRHLKHSPDEIVEVMYPITGRMVAATVKNAIRNLSDSINEQMETRFSVKGQIARWRARRTGRPLSDFLVARSLRAHLRRALILDRDSGTVLNSWQSDDTEGQEMDNVQLVSAMLAALNNLAQEAFDSQAGGLRTLDLDGRQIALRSSARHLVALEFSGELSSAEQQRIDQAFTQAINHLINSDPQTAIQSLSVLADTIEPDHGATANPADRAIRHSNRQPWMAIAIPACLIAALAIPIKQHHQARDLNRDLAKVQQLLEEHPALTGFPITAKANHQAGSVEISGLLPQRIAVTELRHELEELLPTRPLRLSISHVVTNSPWPIMTFTGFQ